MSNFRLRKDLVERTEFAGLMKVRLEIDRDVRDHERILIMWKRAGAPSSERGHVFVTRTFIEDLPGRVRARSWADLAHAIGWGRQPEALVVLYAEYCSRHDTADCSFIECRPRGRDDARVRAVPDLQTLSVDCLCGHRFTGTAGSTFDCGCGATYEIRRQLDGGRLYSVQHQGSRVASRDDRGEYHALHSTPYRAMLEGKLEELQRRAFEKMGLPRDVLMPVPATPLQIEYQRDVAPAALPRFDDPEAVAHRLRIDRAIQRDREAAQPSAVASAPGIDRSGPRVFCQSQYDPDD